MGLLARRSLILAAVPLAAAMASLEACGAFDSADASTADGGATTNPAEASTMEDASAPADGAVADEASQKDGDSPFDGATKDASVDVVDGGGPPGCMGQQACKRFVFVTTATFQGVAIGGVDDGNNKCKAAAAASPKLASRTWRAWLSDATSSPATRNDFPKGLSAYVLPDEITQVAANWNDLVDGQLAHVIDQDATAKPVGPVNVWTGTAANGTSGGSHCNDWAAGGTTGVIGNTASTGGGWSNASQPACSNSYRLYCFEY